MRLHTSVLPDGTVLVADQQTGGKGKYTDSVQAENIHPSKFSASQPSLLLWFVVSLLVGLHMQLI